MCWREGGGGFPGAFRQVCFRVHIKFFEHAIPKKPARGGGVKKAETGEEGGGDVWEGLGGGGGLRASFSRYVLRSTSYMLDTRIPRTLHEAVQLTGGEMCERYAGI